MARKGKSVNGKEPNSLTPRQARFVDEYLVDLNGKQAAIRAGYSARTAAAQAARLLTKVNVADAVAAGKARRQEKVEITQERVLRELAALAFSNHTNFKVDESGQLGLRDGVPESAHAAVSSVEHEIVTGPGGYTTRRVKFKMWDKPGSLKLAGRHVNAKGFWDRVELSGPNGGPMEIRSAKDLSSGERRKRIAELATKRQTEG